MTRLLIMIHALAAVALLGAVTHQCISSWRRRSDEDAKTFAQRFASVTAGAYATPIVIFYGLTFSLGSILYADYRIEVRPLLESTSQLLVLAMFESKEHLAVFGLGLLPGYWALWTSPALETAHTVRRLVTTLIALFVWWSFVTGLFVNNIAGLPS